MNNTLFSYVVACGILAMAPAQSAMVVHLTMDDANDIVANGGSKDFKWSRATGATPVKTGKFDGAAMFTSNESRYWSHLFSTVELDVSAFTLSVHIRTDVQDTRVNKDFISLATDNLVAFTLQKNSEHSVSLLNIGRIGGVESKDLVGEIQINDGKWHHLGVVCDGTVLSLFIDGQFQGQTAYTGKGQYKGFQLGARFGDASYAMHCSLDDVAIYDQALLPSQMKWLANNIAVDEPPVGMEESGVLMEIGGVSVSLR